MSEDLTAIPGQKKQQSRAAGQKAEARLNKMSNAKGIEKKSARKALYAKVKDEETVLVAKQTDAVVGEVVVGRPSIYTQELADEFCFRIAAGESLRKICRDEHMPAGATMFRWMREKDEFREQYTRATQERAEAFHEDILDIADDGSNDWMEANFGNQEAWITNGEALQRSRLRIETRKFLMERMKPKKYGAKLDLTSDNKALPAPLFGGASVALPEGDDES